VANTVVIKSYLKVFEEKTANAAVTPGMLVEPMASGNFRAHATAEGNALPMFAKEDELQGKEITDNYAANDKMQVWIPTRGDIVNAILADGETAVIGSELSSNGDGKLRVHVADDSGDIQPMAIVAIAIEAVDMSGSSAADPDGRIKARAI
jgi:hypothetical protein